MQSSHQAMDDMATSNLDLDIESTVFYNDSFLRNLEHTLASLFVKDDRQKTIDDIRKKFKSQHGISLKITAKKSEDFNTTQSNEKDIQSQVLMKKNERFQDLYSVLDIVGQGSLAVVKKIRKNDTNEIFAAKIVRNRDQEHLDQLRNEFYILAKLEHKNIIKAYDLLVDNDSGTAQLILEFFSSKTLEDLIHERTKIEESIMREIVTQVVSAIDFMHMKGVCHRDIKPSNILISEDYQIKIIDFSTSKIFRKELWSPLSKSSFFRKRSSPLVPSYPGMMLTDTGTPAYKAPEIISGYPYNQSVDIWALGVVVFYALAGYKPFQSKYVESLYKKINSAKIKWDPVAWKNISYEATLFVHSCLMKFPFIRLRCKEALHHPWIKGIKLNIEKPNVMGLKRSSSSQIDKTEPVAQTGKHRISFASTILT